GVALSEHGLGAGFPELARSTACRVLTQPVQVRSLAKSHSRNPILVPAAARVPRRRLDRYTAVDICAHPFCQAGLRNHTDTNDVPSTETGIGIGTGAGSFPDGGTHPVGLACRHDSRQQWVRRRFQLMRARVLSFATAAFVLAVACGGLSGQPATTAAQKP